MGFRNGAYATVWETNEGRGKWQDVRLSISKKNRQTGEYETDFSGTVRFIGAAAEEALKLDRRDRIRIIECDVTNHYDREKEILYTNYAVFAFEFADGNKSVGAKSCNDGFMDIPEGIDDELPFN